MDKIRNFSIIAHIDHGKSTLADYLIKLCGGLSTRESSTCVLDSMSIERERGITIKAHSVTLNYCSLNGLVYQLNFIDTPGHVDFSYEVSRSLMACEGALLIIDATQGIEAQTLANYTSALNMNLKIIPVVSKIDLPSANPKKVAQEIEHILGIKGDDIICYSAKSGIGIIDVIERLIQDIPCPNGNVNAPLQALIIDSWFDNYSGVSSLVRIKNGILHKGDKIKIMSTNQIYTVSQLGVFNPKRVMRTKLNCGEVGWVICGIKDIHGAPVGDTITLKQNAANEALPGFQKIQPQVYASIFPITSDQYENFNIALNKLNLNDSSLFYEPENSPALGFGFRCGFLGLLHMEIIQERLEREYNLNLIITSPTVTYEVLTTNKKIIYVTTPSKLPLLNQILEFREPIAECHILSPQKYLGSIIALCFEKRGIQISIVYHGDQITLIYNIPMAEIILDFSNKLKSISNGYASLNYNFKFFQKSDLVCIEILINNVQVDALSLISHRNHAGHLCRHFVDKLKELIPRHQFDISIQAMINKNVIARSTVKQIRKNVLAKCYGGDVSRKQKLLHKQKKGKKRMKQIGQINLPQEAFLSILYIDIDKK